LKATYVRAYALGGPDADPLTQAADPRRLMVNPAAPPGTDVEGR
jgi:hypothetical protein